MSDAAARPSATHSELMDRIYRHQRHIYDATRKYYLLGRDRMIRGLSIGQGESLLEIGCGTGRNLALAARLYPGARLFGLDISSEMLASARRTLMREGAGQADLRLLDAAAFSAADFNEPGFDRIMISYALSMIPDWQGTIARALEALKPGGSLHIADFGQQEGLPTWFRTILQAWLARFHVSPRADLEAAIGAQIAGRPFRMEFIRHARGYAWIAVIRRIS
jgi:S-adenosylmethionine-diacylgycerolhomoserine-N-methlytransferase